MARLKQLNVKPRHTGVLLKLSDWLKAWRPRYFAIYGTRLFICSDPNPDESEQPKVQIDFTNNNFSYNSFQGFFFKNKTKQYIKEPMELL